MDDNLSFLDAGFLETEDSDPHASLTIGALAIMEGPVPGQDEFRDTVAARFAKLPHARDRVHTVPLDFSAPSWTPDPHFDLGHHLRRVASRNQGRRSPCSVSSPGSWRTDSTVTAPCGNAGSSKASPTTAGPY